MEFGSDFHYISGFINPQNSIQKIYPNAEYFANGRHCILAIIKRFKYQRIWIPEYFCSEVIDSIRRMSDIEIQFYNDNPLVRFSNKDLAKIKFRKGDVLFRVIYFGIEKDSITASVPIIEDHSHSLFTNKAINSNADWCIASLRKTLPIAEGGILWSPKGLRLDESIIENNVNIDLALQRWNAMKIKKDYLEDCDVAKKDIFRKIFISTEEKFNDLPICRIDNDTLNFISKFDAINWYKQKLVNIQYLNSIVDTTIKQITNINNRFSFLLLCKNKEQRELLRQLLIQNNIYPAILWELPNSTSDYNKNISSRILSIHCDARYNHSDIEILGENLNHIISAL